MIWPALYALRDDAGLDATGLRDVFDGMSDLGAPAGWEAFQVRKADDSGFERFQVRKAESGWIDFHVRQTNG
jgi:hypothetical protein